jgi:hypothetical protein
MNMPPRNLRHPVRILLLSGALLTLALFNYGAQGVQAVDIRGDESLQEDETWIDEQVESIRPRLIAEGKNCQQGGLNYYRTCLVHQAAVGAKQEEAIEYCAGYLEQLIAATPADPIGGSGLKGDTSYAWEVDDMTFSYEGRGGSASGTMHIATVGNIDSCDYMIDMSFEGGFDYATCSFQGTGTYSWTCQVNPAVGGKCLLCGEQGEIAGAPGTWTAELRDGEIHGHFATDADPNHGAGFTVKLGKPGNYSNIEESGFLVSLACSPGQPEVGQQVTCTAELRGADENEDLDYTWYVDSAKEADTKKGSWTWGSAEKGVHDITVYVQGEGHDTESTVTLEVGEEAEFMASIGMDPPVPVLEKGVTFTPQVEGAKGGEKLSYRWFLDGNLICETAICTWAEAAGGSRQIQLEVRGEGERISVAQRQFDVVNLVDEKEAGFRIVGLGCNSGVSSDETLICSLGLERDEGVGPLNVTWLIDGVVALTEPGVESGSDMQLSQPAPGEHGVSAVVVEPVEGLAISGQTMAEVIEGKNALIPPWRQAAAAGGTLGLVGVWLWWEWMNARRAEAEEERLRQLQKPSWVDDPRSLEEIWAADVEAERQRRGLWGFEYNENTGIFRKPDWAQGLTEEERKSLLAHGSQMPWWWSESQQAWYESLDDLQASWDRQRQVLQDTKLRADRSLEQEWLREIYQEPSAAKRLKSDMIYKLGEDAWERAPWHPEEIAKQNRALMLKADRAIDILLDRQPVSLWGKVEAMQERFLTANSPNGEDLSRMMRLRGALYNLQQAQYEREKVAADIDAIDAQAHLIGAERMRDLAGKLSLALTVGWLTLGAAGLMGVVSAAEAAAAISGAMLKLGAFRLTMNLIEGTAVGYMEGGFNAAVVGGMRRTLPINTMRLWLGPRMPGDQGPGWKQIGCSFLQDVGNAFTLKRGLAQYKQLAQRAGASISDAYQRLVGTGEQSLRMPPVKHSVLLQRDAAWWAERENGQRLVNNFNRTLQRMNQAAGRLERANFSNQLTKQAIQINESYAAKSILKAVNRPGLSQAFDQRIQRIYRVVDYRVAKELSKEGFTRGGQAFSRSDLMNFRNASSYGSVGMDRDVGLNELLVKKWEGVVNQATPGTDWHAHAVSKLRQAQQASQLAQGGKRISQADFTHQAQKVYDKVYARVTGGDEKCAERAFQVVTSSKHPEAYIDHKVLQNNPAAVPFTGKWAEQTGSVSALKVHDNFNMVEDGLLSNGNAIQESARGLAKDISTKLIPLLKTSPTPNVSQISYWQGMQRLLGEAGKGNITPGQLLQTLGTDESGIIRLAEQTSAGIRSAIQSR